MRRRSATSHTWARTQRSSQVTLANNHCFGQCCGSGMFILDPHYFHPRSRVKKIPGSRIRIRFKEFKYFNPKNCFQALGNMIQDVHSGSGSRIRILIFYPSRIPDLGVKKSSYPGSATLRIWIFMDLALVYPAWIRIQL